MSTATKKRRKKKLPPLQQRKDNPFSKYWESKCDRLFWQIYYSKYSTGICQIGRFNQFVDCSPKIDGHHLIKRENYMFRWEFKNILDICAHHHSRYGKQLGPHSTPMLFSLWLEEMFPDKWDYLQYNKHDIVLVKELPWTFQEKYKELKKELES